MKSLIVFYSFEGNTRLVANLIKKYTNADMIEIKPVKEIGSKGFSKYIRGGKQAVFKEMPKLLEYNLDINKYDQIYLGSPIWASTVAPPLRTFIENEEIENKQIACFFSHRGGGVSKCINELKLILVHNKWRGVIDFVNPLKQNQKNIENQIQEWIENIVKKTVR